MNTIGIVLQFMSAVFAVAAALLWWKSSKVKIPNQIRAFVAQEADSFHARQAGLPSDEWLTGSVQSNDFRELTTGLIEQSKLSKNAAIAASLAAITQVVATAVTAYQMLAR